MKKNSYAIIAVIALALAVVVVGCAKKAETGKNGKGGPGASQRGGPGGPGGKKDPIKLSAAVYKPITLHREYVGEVMAAYSVDMKSTGSGWMKSLSVDIGQRVTKGQEIASVDQEDVQAQVEAASAQNTQAAAQSAQVLSQSQQMLAGIAVAQSAVAKADADLQQSRSDAARTQAMFDKGFVSKASLENAQTTVKTYQAALDAAKAQLDAAKAQYTASLSSVKASQAQLAQTKAGLKAAQVKLGYLTIRAPFSGVVAEKYVDAGAFVSPTVSIVKIVDDSDVKIVINAIEEDIARIAVGAPAEITTDALPNRTFSGRVTRVSPVVESQSRTGTVEILISNPTGELKAGMMARVNLVAAYVPNALVVPVDAVIIDQVTGGKYVMVMAQKDPQRHDVRVGIQTDTDAQILSGLTPGDNVVVGALPPDSGSGADSPQKGGAGKSAGGKGGNSK